MRTPLRTINRVARCVPPGSLAECTVNRLPRGKRHRHANVRRRPDEIRGGISRIPASVTHSSWCTTDTLPLFRLLLNEFLEIVNILIERKEELKEDYVSDMLEPALLFWKGVASKEGSFNNFQTPDFQEVSSKTLYYTLIFPPLIV